MNDTALTVFLLTLAVLIGAAAGSYLAWQPTTQKTEKAVQNISTKAQETLQTLEEQARRVAQGVENLRIDIPPPTVETKIAVSLSPWSAFWIFLATVTGIITARYYIKSKIPTYLKTALKRNNHAQKRNNTQKRRPARTSAQPRKQNIGK